MTFRFYFTLALFNCGFAVAQSWTDRGEYDIALSLRSEADSTRRLQMISQWKEKYPNSAMKAWRAGLELDVAKDAGDWSRVYSSATELVATEPENVSANYWVALLTPQQKGSKESILSGVAASAKVLTASTQRPSSVPEADWPGMSKKLAATAHRTLGWAAWQNQSWATAENELRQAVTNAPADGEASAWLGTVLALQKTPAKQQEAVWHLARAVYAEGEQGLVAAKRHDAKQLLDAVYLNYHGSTEGLDGVGQLAQKSPMPLADFKVETAADAAFRAENEELAKTDPDLAEWMKLRRRLEAPDGQAYLQSISASPILLRGWIIRTAASGRGRDVYVSFTKSGAEEVVLKLQGVPSLTLAPKMKIEFEGQPEVLREPFLLQMTVEKGKILHARSN